MKQRLVLLFASLLTICACKGRRAGTDWSIDRERDLMTLPAVHLSGEEMNVSTENLLTTYAITLIDSVLIACKLVASPGFLEFINLNTGESITSFGALGGGPLEFPDFIRVSLIESDQGLLGIVVPNDNGAYYEIGLQAILTKQLKSLAPKHNFGPRNSSQIAKIDKRKFVTLNIGSKYRLAVLEMKNNAVSGVFEYPFADEMSIPEERLGLAYQGYMLHNHLKKRLAIFDEWSPTWDVIGYDSSEFWSIYSKHLRPPLVRDLSYDNGNVLRESVGVLPDNKMAFFSPSSSKEYIYVLYSGRDYAQWGVASDTPNTVLVFNWEGQIVNKLKLDRDVSCIAVSQDDRYLYAYVEATDVDQIVRYKLPATD